MESSIESGKKPWEKDEKRIKTKRLILRPIEAGDVEAVYHYAGDLGIDMMMFLPHETLADTQQFVEYAVSELEKELPEDRKKNAGRSRQGKIVCIRTICDGK